MKAGTSAKGKGILRLRETIRFAYCLAALRMTGLTAMLLCCGSASATTYYVSSSVGSDANVGTSSTSAWQTIAHVNAQSFLAGDSILFKRGDVWNESLIPPSSGSLGNPITFDAYGTGAAPNLTGYYAVPSTAWVLVSGNAWKAAVPASYTTINFCLFGSIWGEKVSAVSSNLTAQWDFYLASGFVYVYSQGNPATYYNEAIVPMALSNVPVINVNGKTWLTFQHFLVNWFDQYGVYVQGTSDHLVFANMEADSMIPQGTQPLGFYVNESTPGPGDIKIYNSEAHLNYDGFRFDGAATAISMINDKGYANRDGALVDNTGAVTYSYCHFYASSLAVAGSTDVEWTSGTGPIAGAGNVAADTAAAVQVYQRYPAEVTLTVDDAGMTPGADTYYASTVLPLADAAGVPVGAAITVGYPLANTLVSEFQGWINAGRDVTAHSMSHTYYTNTDALEVQYTGLGTAATLSISSKILTIAVTGASDSVSYNLAQGQPQGTMLGLQQALAATGKFTTSYLTPCQGPYGTGCSAYTAQALLAQDLADVSGQNVKSSIYHMLLDVTRLTTDEITLSRQWMTTNLTGLPGTPVYVYPGGYETTTMQGITESVPYTGARGALKEDLGVLDTYADGFNLQNITSFGVNPSWMGLTAASLNQKVQALVWKESVWGAPWGIFWHWNATTGAGELSSTEITNLIADLQASGATIQTNTGLVNWLRAGTQETGLDGNYYYKQPATSMALDFRPTKNSPVVDAGQNLGTAYAIDINGVNQNGYGSGWEIGAHVYVGFATYGEGAGAGNFTIGVGPGGSLTQAILPQMWVNNNEGNSLFSYELSLPGTWVTVAAPGCTFHSPYWSGAPTSSGLQNAINDIEACRTGTGAGLKLDIPPGIYTAASGIVIPQTDNVQASNFLILDSTMDSNLPNGQTVCSHGIQDNLATSTDVGLDNPDCAGDAMSYQLGATVTTAGTPHPNNGMDDLPPAGASGTNWNVCVLPGCNPGGVGNPTGTQTIDNVSPSIDGASMKMTCASATASDCLWFYNAPAEDSDTSLTADFWMYLDANGSTANAFEFVMFQYIAGTVNTELHYSYQCDNNSGFWRVGNLSPSFSWNLTTIPCSLANLTWHHIVFRGHRIAGDTSCSGHPAEYYDSITIDGTVNATIPTECSTVLPGGWSEQTGFNFQQDMGSSAATLTQYVDEVNFTSINPAGAFTLANGVATNPSSYNDVQNMWTVEASGTTPYVLQFCSPSAASGSSNPPWCGAGAETTIGPDHWLIMDAEIRPAAGNKGNINVVNMHNAAETTYAMLPNHIHFRKIWLHGDWAETAAGLQTGANSISAGFALSCYYCSILDSQISQVIRPGAEGHSIDMGWTTVAKINHNWISGSAIGSLCGGLSNAPAIPGLVPCTNIEWRRNRYTFPNAWLGNQITSNPNWTGTVSKDRKNAFEQKEGFQDVVDGNIIENVDNSGGQNGPYGDFKSINTSGGLGQNYWSMTANITVSNTIYRNACNGIQVEARSDGSAASLSYPSYGMYNLTFRNDLFYNATESNPGCSGGSEGMEFQSNPAEWQGTITGNGTTATFTATCAPQVAGNCPSGPAPAGFSNMGIIFADPLWISGCTTQTGFNTAITSVGGHASLPVLGVKASGGSAGLSVSFPSTVSGTDSSGNCQINYIQGYPLNLNYSHNTFVNNLTWSFADQNTPTQGPNYAINSTILNNITLGGGWFNNPYGEGTDTEVSGWDVNTLTAGYDVWPTRTASKYSEYEPKGACAVPTGCTPPITMYFPTTDYCTGATPTSSCVGFTGAMSATSMPMTLTDYHGFELLAGSVFKAGGSEPASDGIDMGANIPAIDAAETANTYVCASPCGSLGPYPDSLTGTAPSTLFGFTEDSTAAASWPTVSYGMQRFWDSPPLQWPSINTAAGVFNFSNIDTMLAQGYAEGISSTMYTLARTPTWASSNASDATCGYTTAASGGGDGQCDAPYDLNSDGSGTNATWKAWITEIAGHVNAPSYCTGVGAGHACIKYWEIWNEPDTWSDGSNRFWAGTFAQLARLTEDANCIITGRGVIHENGSAGTATPCTATAIDATAKIVMASGHAESVALTFAENQLYCNDVGGIPAGELPCPVTTDPIPGDAIAKAVDIINFHMKPGNETGNTCPAPTLCTPESAMQMYVANIHSILQPSELAKPLWDGEASYSTVGFSGTYSDPDMAASLMPRLYLVDWSLGISGMAWYTWDELSAESSEVQTSYQQTYNWLSESSLTSSCAAAGTVWSCGISQSGKSYLVMWDTSQSCSGGICTTGSQTVGAQWGHYQDMTTASIPLAIAGHSVPVGIKAVVLSQ